MQFKLCYVERPWAWFTTAKLEDQTGDDHDDASGIIKIAWWCRALRAAMKGKEKE